MFRHSRRRSQSDPKNSKRDVDFSIAVFDSWSDYQQYLKGDPDLIWDLLAKYQDALSDLRDKAPSYISQMKYNKDESSAPMTWSSTFKPASFALES